MADTNDKFSHLEEGLRQFERQHPEHTPPAETKAAEAAPAPTRPAEPTFSSSRALPFLNDDKPKFGE